MRRVRVLTTDDLNTVLIIFEVEIAISMNQQWIGVCQLFELEIQDKLKTFPMLSFTFIACRGTELKLNL